MKKLQAKASRKEKQLGSVEDKAWIEQKKRRQIPP